AKKIQEKLKEVIKKNNLNLVLNIYQIGNNSSSNIYIKKKQEFGQYIGIQVNHIKLEENDIAQTKLIELLKTDQSDGLIIQLPLASKYDQELICSYIPFDKDVDGLNEKSNFYPVTALATLFLLKAYKINLKNKKIAVVGQSKIVGKPLSYLLEKESKNNVDKYDLNNKPPQQFNQDLIAIAIDKPNHFKNYNFKKESIIVDIGFHKINNKTYGNVDRNDLDVKAITPIIGGIGPLTVSFLFINLLKTKNINLDLEKIIDSCSS
ncbi:MAG: bifunctional 5,10-methylenetetrahydrofolate dehydrogenase/5,10-methenyltetrahydrofolate cyclohydrolase, partial [Mycoplasma sp.]|nr:bifunctional 5,10-methylenetetrahydrofolate dehydrogenase/5,10-methenyltetrahydrofolate cyclohydrolase [Mycoplasma sp.]